MPPRRDLLHPLVDAAPAGGWLCVDCGTEPGTQKLHWTDGIDKMRCSGCYETKLAEYDAAEERRLELVRDARLEEMTGQFAVLSRAMHRQREPTAQGLLVRGWETWLPIIADGASAPVASKSRSPAPTSRPRSRLSEADGS